MPEKRQNFRKKMRKPRFSVLGKSLRRFYILALSQKKVRFFSCNLDSIQEEPLAKNVPSCLSESESVLELHKQYQGHAIPSASKPGFMTHGHGGGREDEKLRIQEFIHQVSQGVSRVLKSSRLILILAAVEYEACMFREESSYPYLADEMIPGNPDLLSSKKLHRRAFEIMKKIVRKEHLGGTIDTDQTTKQG